MGEEFKLGVDVQVAVKDDAWVKSLRHPGEDYCYIGDRETSFLVTKRFWGDREYPDNDGCVERIKQIGIDKILKAQCDIAASE